MAHLSWPQTSCRISTPSTSCQQRRCVLVRRWDASSLEQLQASYEKLRAVSLLRVARRARPPPHPSPLPPHHHHHSPRHHPVHRFRTHLRRTKRHALEMRFPICSALKLAAPRHYRRAHQYQMSHEGGVGFDQHINRRSQAHRPMGSRLGDGDGRSSLLLGSRAAFRA